jgi:integrase
MSISNLRRHESGPLEDEIRGAPHEAATFAQVAADFINVKKPGWKNKKHAEQWTNTLTTYAFPVIGNKSCSDITREDVLKILKPIWTEKHETATRLRGRIEAIWSSAEAKGLCEGKNPAQWKGNLEHSLSNISKARRTKHHAAMPYADVPYFISNLMQDPTISARALALCILTATRTGELIGARWNEIDLQSKCWNIPAERMKMHRAHRVPLSDAAISVLESLTKTGDADEFVFKGHSKATKGLSNMAMLAYLKGRSEYKELTVHGFRSSFRDWAGEQTGHTREVIEHALAHRLADQTEAAYQRGDYFDKRRVLMQDWADFCLAKK